ncbi:aspartate aminotransferase family protein [Frankia sp. AgPm24]|uniref:aspartate aminotransferase family protein n=1 Tax=Frankia sp. AgPm24 TaxID=631128 RepID=UPI00200BCA69|nr:aspartate aminotransferase family protein [Frankia sp. AgPm24]MCK9924069.1 aspartate aminotransferase family protein [Frankia sp. AgPm24]
MAETIVPGRWSGRTAGEADRDGQPRRKQGRREVGALRARAEELTEREEARLRAGTPGSRRMHERAVRSMTSGVPSSYQVRDPWPIYLTHGVGSRVWDVDGTEYADFHNGYGSMVQGHAHPAIVRAVRDRIGLGSHFAMPTEDSIVVSEELARRFGLPQWRYVNSGSEATMDAIRIARGVTGRDTIIKIFGSYHGHHDYVMVSIGTPYADIGPAEHMNSLGYGAGIPQAVIDLTVPVPFNDASSMERRIEELESEGRLPACVIMEAAMMNLGVVLPEPGYLQAVREITARHGIVLIFDEVKTGLCVAPGGATQRFGVRPDMVTLAKALGGGLPSGAIGATAEIMEVVASDRVKQVGTFNGNPLSMAAARASLLEVLTPAAYDHLDRLNDRLIGGCDTILTRYGIPGYTVGISSKGCVNITDAPIRDYTSFMAHQVAELPDLAWLYHANRGVLMAPGREEEWTLSVQHTDADVDRYLDGLDQLAQDLVAAG